MRIAVLGTGSVGRALASRLSGLGHQVTVGTRDPEATLARVDDRGRSWAGWSRQRPDVGLASFADAAAGAELIVCATAGSGALAALTAAGAARLAGKVVLDVSNPLAPGEGPYPTLAVADTDSLAEGLQRAFPGAFVVKSLNTVNAAIMADPRSLAEGDHTVFISGDDPDAKAAVQDLLEQMGHTDVLDLGDLASARGAEMGVALWLRVFGALGHPDFNFKIVR